MCVGDQAVVVTVDRDGATALVDVDGRRRVVSLALVPAVAVGTRVVVHTGFILEVLDASPPPQIVSGPGGATDPGGRT